MYSSIHNQIPYLFDYNQSFSLSRLTQICKSVLQNSSTKEVSFFQNSPKNLDSDEDFFAVFILFFFLKEKPPSYC